MSTDFSVSLLSSIVIFTSRISVVHHTFISVSLKYDRSIDFVAYSYVFLFHSVFYLLIFMFNVS